MGGTRVRVLGCRAGAVLVLMAVQAAAPLFRIWWGLGEPQKLMNLLCSDAFAWKSHLYLEKEYTQV